MAKKKPSEACKCRDAVDAELKNIGVKLESALQVNFSTGKGSMAGPFLLVKWIDKPKRGKRLPLITCAYCPMCGKPSQ